MIDLARFVDTAPSYYGQRRSAMGPALGAVYGETVAPSGSPESSPPVSLRALEASEMEAVALWRILAHYKAEKPFNPYMRAKGRRVVGLKLDADEIVHYMADDAADCLAWDLAAAVPRDTVAFCGRARAATIKVVGESDGEDWFTQDEVMEFYGVSRKLLWWWRDKGLVRFREVGDQFLYSRTSVAEYAASR